MPEMSILLVEDSSGDVVLAREAFRDAGIDVDLVSVADGEKALAQCQIARPDLVLLDLDLPRMNGLDVLARLRSDPLSRTIPVVMLTTSQAERDIAASYERGANSYVVKPLALDDFTAAITIICDFWLGLARLPPS